LVIPFRVVTIDIGHPFPRGDDSTLVTPFRVVTIDIGHPFPRGDDSTLVTPFRVVTIDIGHYRVMAARGYASSTRASAIFAAVEVMHPASPKRSAARGAGLRNRTPPTPERPNAARSATDFHGCQRS